MKIVGRECTRMGLVTISEEVEHVRLSSFEEN